jgi:hypothetical protein
MWKQRFFGTGGGAAQSGFWFSVDVDNKAFSFSGYISFFHYSELSSVWLFPVIIFSTIMMLESWLW